MREDIKIIIDHNNKLLSKLTARLDNFNKFKDMTLGELDDYSKRELDKLISYTQERINTINNYINKLKKDFGDDNDTK